MALMYPDEPEAMHSQGCAVGPGGNIQLINGDEAEILEATLAGCQVRAEGMQEPGRH